MKEDGFAPCPDTPNCVSSQDVDTRHHIEPLRYTGDMTTAKTRLLEVVEGFRRTRIIEDTGPYIHASFMSWLFRFTDDVEFRFDDAEKLIHMRSASRVGYSDLGVNRRRCEAIRKAFGRSAKE
jgi:uncharacterized protein (DUF1499 family)